MSDIRKFPLILLLLTTVSCGVTYKLTQEDLAWVPYSVGDVLVFKNNAGDTDSILISAVNRHTAPEDPLAARSKNHEHLIIGGYYSESKKRLYERRSPNIIYLELSARKNGICGLDFDLKTDHAQFYSDSNSYNRKRFDLLPLLELTTAYGVYNDIVMVPVRKGKRNAGDPDYSQQDNFVTALYWSKTKGIIRYDLKNGQSWVLSERFSTGKSTYNSRR